MKIAHEIISNNSKIKKTDSIVIFWGYSGTGKSSAIIILSGQGVKGYKNTGVPCII